MLIKPLNCSLPTMFSQPIVGMFAFVIIFMLTLTFNSKGFIHLAPVPKYSYSEICHDRSLNLMTLNFVPSKKNPVTVRYIFVSIINLLENDYFHFNHVD